MAGHWHPTESCVKSAPTLPDDVLREIFAFCVSCTDDSVCHMRYWKSLVQVCTRWREIIYASQHYLSLYLYLSNGDNVEEIIDSWPEFPVVVDFAYVPDEDEDEDEATSLRDALAQRDRIRRIQIVMTVVQVGWFAELMEDEFPRLMHLDLVGYPKYDPINVPNIALDGFLGGSAPSLQHLCIEDFDYFGLPLLVSSAPNLVSLQIKDIRLDCYESPEVMIGALAGLTKLRDLCIAFSPSIHTDDFWYAKVFLSSHTPTHAVFPALAKLQIEGDNEYMEDLINLIEAP